MPLIYILFNIPLNSLGAIGEEAILTAAKSMEIVKYKKGDYIMRQNEIGDSFYILESGHLSVQVE